MTATSPPKSSVAIDLRILDAGDSAIFIQLGETIDPGINARILALDAAIKAANIAGVVETVPTYRSLMVQFDPLVLDFEGLVAFARVEVAKTEGAVVKGRRWRVPVVYGGEFGIDLEDVAAHHKISTSKLIEKHAAPVYRCYMIGFMPGYTYLGGLDPSIAVPRRLDPRLWTPAGTISIGGIQALVAGQAMPSGWHLLGRTPVRTFDPNRQPTFLFEPGDEVVFEPIDASKWEALEKRTAAGEITAEVVAA